MFDFKEVETVDSEIAAIIMEETRRQQRNIELIASENIVSKAVMAAMGSTLTNKYAEGYPGKRYYGGCEYVDKAERLAIERAKVLFGAEAANVQPHSGAQANFCIFYGFLKPGDTVLSMGLAHGGHLSHGSPVNISGAQYNVISYEVNESDHRINYENVRELALKHKPKLIIAGASAYSREIDFKVFGDIAKESGAYLLVDMAHIAGLVASGHHMSPVPYADFVTSTTHKTLRGPRGGLILMKEEHAAAVNKSVFPGTQGGPLMHTIAAKAVCFKEALDPSFKEYMGQVVKNADVLSKALINKGFDVVSGGTDNHLMLVDLRKLGVTGKEMETRLDTVNVTANKNAIPFDPEKPFVTSGIRLGTPSVTARGFTESDMEEIADIIYTCAADYKNSKDNLKQRATALTDKYPIYE